LPGFSSRNLPKLIGLLLFFSPRKSSKLVLLLEPPPIRELPKASIFLLKFSIFFNFSAGVDFFLTGLLLLSPTIALTILPIPEVILVLAILIFSFLVNKDLLISASIRAFSSSIF